MISERTQLKIANICYASVSGMFARFCNPKNRGPNFTWDFFVEHCEDNADLWLTLQNLRRTKANKDEIDALARQYAGEIARQLVKEVK